MKRVLVTGAEGFIGKNLVMALSQLTGIEVIRIDINSSVKALDQALTTCDIIFHLAGINRPIEESEFITGNVGSLISILEGLKKRDSRPLIVLSSSTQALLNNPYGRSKRQAETILLNYYKRTTTPVRIFRLPGVFGKWSRPDYNSVVTTFCYNIARDLPIRISNPNTEIEIIHIDDIVFSFIALINEVKTIKGAEFGKIEPIFKVTLGSLAEKLHSFHSCRKTLFLPELTDPFERRLFGTYMSYLPEAAFAYSLPRKDDNRGELTEFLKLNGHGQIFISKTRPGITRGNHYHGLKVEKFLVLEGEAVIRLRSMATGEIVDYSVSGTDMKVVDIPPGWTHSIENVGAGEMVVLFWSSEVFDPSKPDTYAADVVE